MLENFEGVQKAYDLAMESAGSATQENARYMESLEAKTANLKAAFEDLVLGDGGIHDFIAFTLDAGTAILEGLQNPVVQLTIELVALTAVVRDLDKLLALNAVSKLGAAIKEIYTAISVLGAKGGIKMLGYELVDLLGGTLSVATAGASIISAFVIMFAKLEKGVEDYKEEIESLTPDYQGLETIQKQAEETAKTLELSKQEFEETSSKVEEYQKTLETLGSKTNRTKSEEEQLQAALKGINAIFPSLNASIDSNTGMLNLEGGVVSELTVAYEKLATAKALAMEISAKESEWTALTNSLNALDDQIEQINKDYAEVDSFWNWYGVGGPVKGGASYGFGRDYTYTMAYRDKNKELKELEKQRSAITSQLDDLRRSQNSLQHDISENVSDFLQNAFTPKSSGSGRRDDDDDPDKSSKKAEDALKKLKSSFDEIISVMEHKISLDKQAGASTEEQIQAYKDLQTETHRQAQVYRSMGLSETHEYIRSLQKLWWQYYDTIQELQKKAYEEEISYQKNLVSALSFYADEQKTSLDKQIEALNEELQALENQNDEREKALELTKAQQNLEDARKQKIRVYQKGQGWTWVSDPRKVAEAEEELESIQRERALEDEKRAIQDRIDAYEKQKQAWSDVVSDYGKYQNRLELEMQLGTTIEKAIFGDRTKNIENFKDAYIKAINSMITAQQKLNEMNDVKTTLPSESMIGGTSGGGATATTTGGGGGGGVNKYSSSDDRSVMEAKMKANSKAWHGADSATKKKLESENQKIGKALGMKYTSSTGKWAYASGTTGMPSTQLALVGERGAELGIFPQGTGIIPHNLTQNLMEIGKYSMNQLKAILSKPSGSIDKSSHIAINELKVNSNSADNFVRQLQNMVFNQR